MKKGTVDPAGGCFRAAPDPTSGANRMGPGGPTDPRTLSFIMENYCGLIRSF